MKKIILVYIIGFFCIALKAQNVGIGTVSPTGPLSFNNDLGNKIVFWGDGNFGHYGMGIQSGLIQLYTDAPAADIAFGSGSSSSFNERMRIINGGGDGLVLNGRIYLKNGTNPLDLNYGSGIWIYKADNSGLLGFMGVENNQNLGFYGGPAGWGFTYDAINSRVGIGNNNPNAPLAFGAVLGKKITLYPGGQGDAGLGMAGNRLQIYSDNPNADVAFGYDAAGTFIERFAMKPNGALAVNGNTGLSGQQLISNGSGASATWVDRPSALYFNRTSPVVLDGSIICANIQGINGQTFSLTTSSIITYQYCIPLFANNGGFGGASRGGLSIQILNNGGTVVSEGNSQFQASALVSQTFHVIGVGDLPAGSYSIRARMIRDSPGDGATYTNSGVYGTTAGCNDIPIYSGQLIMQIFPK